MQIVTFHTPYHNGKLWSLGNVIADKGTYLEIEITAGNMAGHTTHVEKHLVTRYKS